MYIITIKEYKYKNLEILDIHELIINIQITGDEMSICEKYM